MRRLVIPVQVMAERKLSSFLLVIEDSWGYVFGGYCPCPFQNATGYYGTGCGPCLPPCPPSLPARARVLDFRPKKQKAHGSDGQALT